MILKDAVQTSFLIVGFFTLIVFGLSYYFILSDIEPSNQPLKDALAITASFFGGFATLTAAYIASKLFNDWKDGYNKSVEREFIGRIRDSFRAANLSLSEFSEAFYAYQINFGNMHELSDAEFDALPATLKVVVSKLKGVSLLFTIYEDDLKQYFTLFKPAYDSSPECHLNLVYKNISEIQKIKVDFANAPSAIDKISKILDLTRSKTEELDREVNQILLSRIKA